MQRRNGTVLINNMRLTRSQNRVLPPISGAKRAIVKPAAPSNDVSLAAPMAARKRSKRQKADIPTQNASTDSSKEVKETDNASEDSGSDNVSCLEVETAFRMAIKHISSVDDRFTGMHEQFGLPVMTPIPDNTRAYHNLVRTIVYQQLAGKAASTIFGRVTDIFNGELPAPKVMMATSDARLSQAGLSKSKVAYIKNLSEFFDTLDTDVRDMDDKEVSSKLLSIKGVGQWTVDMFLMFSLHRQDVLPLSDLGVKKGMQSWFSLASLPTPQKMEELFEPFRPHRSLATWYMWKIANTLPPSPKKAKVKK